MDQTGFAHRLRRCPDPLRRDRRQRHRRTASVLVMAVLSAAWTVQIARPFDAGAGSAGPAAAPGPAAVDLPQVEPGQPPASYSAPPRSGPWTLPRRDAAVQLVTQSSRGVPFTALAAYQRAETVIVSADATCGADWQLLAAIGQVESDHGRSGSNVVGLDGISRPGVFGIALDGTHRTQAISDTDGGRFDHDKAWDRAVGPMQFIPTTWREVAVDADSDGERNPQDIDDAALASAVYLCAGEGDLATAAGRREALLRYNPSKVYGDLVLRIRAIYLRQGAGAEVGLSGGSVSALARGNAPSGQGPRGQETRLHQSTPGGTPTPQEPPSREPTPLAPNEPTDDPKPAGPLKAAVSAVTKATEPVLSALQATVTCASQGLNVLLDAAAWARCFEKLTSP